MEAGVSAAGCVMLLVDADNVSADVIEQALQTVAEAHGTVHIRRAYCTAEAAAKHQALFRRLSIRPMVNLATGKNSTDIALALDAMDLAQSERPALAVIVSSDSDFAPLVIRLREKGCRVWGIGQQGKTGDGIEAVYDVFTVLTHRGSRAPAAAPAASTRVSRAAPAAAAPAPRAAKTSRGRKTAASKPAAPKPAAPALPDEVLRILDAVPALRDGQALDLRVAAEPLRAAGLLSKSAPSTKLFRKHAPHFALTPERNPNKVQFLASAG
jgi:hypothetical protein